MPLKRAVTEFGKTYKDRFALRTYPGTSVPIFIFILGWSRTKPRVTLSAQTMLRNRPVFTMVYAKCVYLPWQMHILFLYLPWFTQNAFTMVKVYLPWMVHRMKIVFTMVHAMLSSVVQGLRLQ